MSSTLAFTGGLGQLDLAAAGTFLDALAQRRAARKGRAWWWPTGTPTSGKAGYRRGGGGHRRPGAGRDPEEPRRLGHPRAKSGEALRRLLAADLPRAVVASRDVRGLIAEADSVTAETLLSQMGPAHGGEKAARPELSTPYVEPGNEREAALAALWEELFGIAPIGADDSFLELGGHSAARHPDGHPDRNRFEADLPVTELFESPTVSQLAKAVGRAKGEESAEDLEALLALVEGLSPEDAAREARRAGGRAMSGLDKVTQVSDRLSALTRSSGPCSRRCAGSRPRRPPARHSRRPSPVTGPDAAGDWPLSIDQERLWRMHRENPGLISWNVDAASRMRGDLDVAAMEGPARGRPPPRRPALQSSPWWRAAPCSG